METARSLRYPHGAMREEIHWTSGNVVSIDSTWQAKLKDRNPEDASRIVRRAPDEIEKALRAEASLTFQGVHYDDGGGGWDELDMDVVMVNGEHLLILQNHKEGH